MIYRISYSQNAMCFAFDELDLLSAMPDFDVHAFGNPLRFEWNTPRGQFIGKDEIINALPDISYWLDKTLILNDRAKNALYELLASVGELYPVLIDGHKYHLFNPHIELDDEVINHNESEQLIEGGYLIAVARHVFLSEKINDSETPLFTTEYDRGVRLFCGERFKELIKNEKLTGLSFIQAS